MTEKKKGRATISDAVLPQNQRKQQIERTAQEIAKKTGGDKPANGGKKK
jgi:hypothetical protein